MAPTSDERREVAARLRKCGAELSILGADCETAFHVIDKVISCREEDSWERFLGRLADLIDPTCDAEQDYDRDEPIQGRWWKCDVCGEHFIYERGFAPRFCPECGARVVDDD
jgi:rubrerythrin